ncbi:MAG TPA: efflux RND transporter permease subunit [Steroidobacteraceae bacterium]
MSRSPTSSSRFQGRRPSRSRPWWPPPWSRCWARSISGVEHIYSASSPGLAVLGVQFKVGERRTEAIVRLYNAIYSNQDWRPRNAGILQPLVKPKGIDDVPIVTLTLWTEDPARGSYELGEVAHSIETEIKRVPGTRNVYTIGSPQQLVRVRLDPQRLAGYGLTTDDLSRALLAANVVQHAGDLVGANRVTPVEAGSFLADSGEVAGLVVGADHGKPVFLSDVADVSTLLLARTLKEHALPKKRRAAPVGLRWMLTPGIHV